MFFFFIKLSLFNLIGNRLIKTVIQKKKKNIKLKQSNRRLYKLLLVVDVGWSV